MISVRTYPPAKPRTIAPSAARAHTQLASGGFMRSVMRHRDVDCFDDHREKKHTQKDQDAEDQEAQKRAMNNLVSSWQERLQLITVITTFFASAEAAMLVDAESRGDSENSVLRASSASLLGALIAHVYASVLSFLGAFLLIRCKLREATREEMIVEGISVVDSPLGGSMIKHVERDPTDLGQQRTLTGDDAPSMTHESMNDSTATSVPERNKRNGSCRVEPPIFSADPHIEQVGPFVSHVSSHTLLGRTHALCVSLAAMGSILAIIGVLCYAWAMQPRAVGMFVSTCLGGAVFTMLALFI